MVDIFYKTIFLAMMILIIVGLYFHYRVQYLMFFKVRPILKQHGLKNSGIFPLGYKKDLILYEEICSRNNLKSDLNASVRASEKRSWIFIIISSLLLAVLIISKAYFG